VSARAGGARTRLALLPVAPFDGEGRAVVPELRLVPPAGSEEATARRVNESAGEALPGDVATTQEAPAKRHRADLSTSPVSRARSADATDRQPSPPAGARTTAPAASCRTALRRSALLSPCTARGGASPV